MKGKTTKLMNGWVPAVVAVGLIFLAPMIGFACEYVQKATLEATFEGTECVYDMPNWDLYGSTMDGRYSYLKNGETLHGYLYDLDYRGTHYIQKRGDVEGKNFTGRLNLNGQVAPGGHISLSEIRDGIEDLGAEGRFIGSSEVSRRSDQYEDSVVTQKYGDIEGAAFSGRLSAYTSQDLRPGNERFDSQEIRDGIETMSPESYFIGITEQSQRSDQYEDSVVTQKYGEVRSVSFFGTMRSDLQHDRRANEVNGHLILEGTWPIADKAYQGTLEVIRDGHQITINDNRVEIENYIPPGTCPDCGVVIQMLPTVEEPVVVIEQTTIEEIPMVFAE